MARRFDCPPRPARLGSWLPSVLLVTMLAACGHNPPPPGPEPGTPAANVVVSVQNHNVSDVDVFANVNGVRQRLGTVTAQGSGSFEVNWVRSVPPAASPSSSRRSEAAEPTAAGR